MNQSAEHASTAADIAARALPAAPPVAVGAANLMGIPLPDIVQWVTLIYLIVLIASKIVEIWRGVRSSAGVKP
ncbi:hypothetical protein [Derxia gummosa]|uniref:Uncharacterized protein n=1 Tax=Derxia gummosa DSM 723 TaxID=1121388 RepID=A0A8B6X782_9BURK|nr:hypothetical protein [Derxia gummosa]